jgi:hypothetical protein
MNSEVIYLLAASLILFGLTKSTEAILDLRQRRRDHGDDSKLYL